MLSNQGSDLRILHLFLGVHEVAIHFQSFEGIEHGVEATDVVIRGCGPTGAMLSTSLVKMNISNIVLEQEAWITTDLRDIALDEDGIRRLQGADLYPSVYSRIGTWETDVSIAITIIRLRILKQRQWDHYLVITKALANQNQTCRNSNLLEEKIQLWIKSIQ